MSRRTASKDMLGRKSSAPAKPSVVKKPSTTLRPGKKPSVPETTAKKEFQLPALSRGFKPKVTESELEKMKKKTIRRNAPPGEDLKQIKEILKTLKGRPTTVHDFVSLIAPSTGDRGEVLRMVMQEDLNSFRKLARKVYETATQDSSDVLHNQQLQLAEFYKERKIILNDRMMKMIEEIYLMVPKFDFERYAADKEKYLQEVLPLPSEIIIEPEEMEMMKRQAAYHRLQWLRSEGERLNDENNSLKKRLNDLKRMHREEQSKMMQMEEAAEAKKEALEAKQAQQVETLEKLSESLEKTIIDNERMTRESQDKLLTAPGPRRATSKKKVAIKKKKPSWITQSAKDIESRALTANKIAEMTKVKKRRGGVGEGGFSNAAVKTPPPRVQPPKPPSPFHYSPPPAIPVVEQAEYVTPVRQNTPTSLVATPLEEDESVPRRYGRRSTQGPKDTWRGFY